MIHSDQLELTKILLTSIDRYTGQEGLRYDAVSWNFQS